MKRIIYIALLLGFACAPAYARDIGFMGISIGMTREQVLNYADEKKIIEVPKNKDVEFFRPEIPQMYLQFYNEKLYAITVIFDEKYLDYFALAGSLAEKYGGYAALSPSWRKWEFEGVEIKVEKPAVVKYIALKEFLEVTDFKKDEGYTASERRKMFLDGL
jgi:hypothetical protein